MVTKWNKMPLLGVALALVGCGSGPEGPDNAPANHALLRDDSSGDDWPAYGRTYGEQHFSPLADVNDQNVEKLGLAWALDLGVGNPVTVPLAVNGIIYFSRGLSVIHAVDAVTGRVLWVHDSRVGEQDTEKMRPAWGSRGIAYGDGKIYAGTQDGRLVALDAATGKEVWTATTTEKGDGRYITGAPRLFNGKVIIGHGGSDTSNARGYVTAYDAATGKQLWRFFIVPGDPAKGFENKAMEMAAATWTGEWWKYGGGGAAWNAFTYDPSTDTILIGTGNGSPWNQKIRSPGGGDNLFLCSIVALDARTGAYKWHYQINPGETWDYNATMDMVLADIRIGDQVRKVVMQAPKNGFFYVIDRTNGKLISAEKITKVTWATRIDTVTGRPVEVPGARFPKGQAFELWPSLYGAHNWMPMAFNPKNGLVYIPKLVSGAIYKDQDGDLDNWQRSGGNAAESGVHLDLGLKNPEQFTSELLAWNPVTQKKAWSVKTFGGWNGGVLATAGNLVFQGQLTGRFSAYAADSGKELWHFPAQAAVLAAPITFRANGRQYVTVMAGIGASPGVAAGPLNGLTFDYRTQRKRMLTFMIDGKATLPPPAKAAKPVAQPDRDFRRHASVEMKGAQIFGLRCLSCHGWNAVAGGSAPDLRVSAVLQSQEVFRSVVRDGALVDNGMPKFPELQDEDMAALRQYLRGRAADLREGKP